MLADAHRLSFAATTFSLFVALGVVPWLNWSAAQARVSRSAGRPRAGRVSIRDHGIPPIDAIHAALTGRPWLPIPLSA